MANEKMEQRAEQRLDHEPSQEKGIHVSRRKLLATLGMAGAAIAAGNMLPGSSTAYGKEELSVAGSVYEEVIGKGKIPILKAANLVVSTTIAEIRENLHLDPKFLYFVRDEGKEGHFTVDLADTASVDNTGTVVVSASGVRLKRMMVDDSIDVRWFGAVGDGVTDNTAAFTNALNSVRATGGTVFVPKGTFLLKKALVLNDRMNLMGQYAESKLVFELAGNTATTTGVLVLGSDLVVERLYIDVKLTSTLHGFRGNNVTVGEYESASYKNLHNIVVRDLWLTRQDTGYLNNALAISGDAHHVLVENIKVRGKNVIGIMAHWSGDAPANNNSLVSYHPHDIDIRNVDIEDSQEAAICPSSSYNFRVSGFKARNVKTVFRAIAGDLGDSRSYAGNGTTHEDQRGKAMTGIVLENVYAEKVETTAIYFGLMGAIKDSQGNTVWYRARQSSGMIRNVEVSGLDSSHYAFQIDRFSNLTIDHIRAANYKGYSVHMYRVNNVRLSELILQDVKRGVLIQQSSHVKIIDGNIRLEEANVRTDADAYPVRIEGSLKTITLAQPLQVGDTTLMVTASFDSLEYGQLIEIVGAGTVKVSDYYVSTTVASFHIEPSAIEAPAGAQVISWNVAHEIDIVRCNIRNGHSGVFYPFHVDGVTVRDCDMDNLFYYGIYGGMGSSVGLTNVSILRNRIRRCGVNVLDPNVASPTYTGQIIAKNTNVLTIRDNVLGVKGNETVYSVQVHDTCSNAIVEDNISLGVRNTTEYAFDFFDQNAAALALGTNMYKANRLLGQGKLRKGAGVSHELADSGNRIVRAATSPSTGIWMVADLVYNTAPAAGGYVGWVCTQGGTMTTAAWSTSRSLTVGSVVYTAAKRVYRCTAAGATGTSEPTHTSGTAVNGTTVLQYDGPLAEFKAFGPIVSP